jgi:hypothetical protein
MHGSGYCLSFSMNGARVSPSSISERIGSILEPGTIDYIATAHSIANPKSVAHQPSDFPHWNRSCNLPEELPARREPHAKGWSTPN